MPRVSERRAEERRVQILDAASRCFARKGLHRTTMQEICKAAKLSPGSVYTWFPSKRAIIAETSRRRLASFEAAMKAARHDPRAGIAAYMATVRHAAENPAAGWMNLHLVSEASRDKFARETMQRVIEGGVAVLEKALLGLRPGHRAGAAARARLLQAAAFGIVIQTLIAPGSAASFDLAEQLIAE